MKYFFLLTTFAITCLLPAISFPQKNSSFKLIRSIHGDIVDFTVDNLNNIYIINSTDQIKKLNANGDSVAVYNNIKKYGKVSQIDVSNALKILLYYKDFSTIVTLDRLMTVRSTIDLGKKNIFQVKTIGLSYDNNIWVFDELENKLKKINDD